MTDRNPRMKGKMESVPQAILSQIAKDFFTDQLSQKKSWQEPDNQITGVIQSLYLALHCRFDTFV